jgi:hypothetical protein
MLTEELQMNDTQERILAPTLTMEEWSGLISIEKLSSDLDSEIHNFYHRK